MFITVPEDGSIVCFYGFGPGHRKTILSNRSFDMLIEVESAVAKSLRSGSTVLFSVGGTVLLSPRTPK